VRWLKQWLNKGVGVGR